MVNQNYQILINKLDAFIRKYYKNRLLKGTLYTLILLLLAFILFASLEYFAQFNKIGRSILFYLFLGLSSYVLVYFILIPTLKLFKLGKTITHQQAAAIIGNHFSEVRDKLINVLELNELSKTQHAPLVMASIDQKAITLNPVSFNGAIKLSENKKYLKYLLIPFLLLVGIFTFSPQVLKEGSSRIVNHHKNIVPPLPYTISISNPSLSVLKNENFTLEIEVKGTKVPDKIYVENNGVKSMLTKKNKRTYSYVFKNVQKDVRFKFFSTNRYSKAHHLTVVPNPVLNDFSIDISYPNYVQRKNEQIKNRGDLIVPEGTTISWKIITEDADLLTFKTHDSIYRLTPENQQTIFTKRFFHDENYFFLPSNQFVSNKDTANYFIQVIPDKHPSITHEEIRDSLNERSIYFKGQISDDYGFSMLTFNYRAHKHEEEAADSSFKQVKIPISEYINNAPFFHFVELAALDLTHGEGITYYFEVWDNDGVNGSKSSRTLQKSITSKTKTELQEKVNGTNKAIKNNLKESIDSARELQEDLEKLQKKLSEKQAISWEEKQEVQRLLDRQSALEKKLGDIQQQNQENNAQQNEFKTYDEELLKKQDQLQQLFDDLMTDEMKEMMEKMREMMEKMDKGELQEEMEQMDLSNQELEKELDRSLELFKQMEFEQALEDTKKKVEDLAREQKEVAEETSEKSNTDADLKEKQETIKEKFEDIKKELEQLEEMNEQLEHGHKMDDQKALQQQIDEALQKSSEQLQKNKNNKANEEQQKAAEKMDQMAQNLSDMQAEMNSGEDMEALRQLLENLLHVSFAQEDLMQQYKSVSLQSPEYVKLTQQQQRIKEDTKMIEDSLFALSKRVVQLESTINKEISSINNNMDKTIALMADRLKPLAASRQQYVMTSINNLALLFDESLQQMQQQAQQKQGNGSCNKPGAQGKPKPGFGSMKKMQEQLNKQLKELEKALNEGKKPGGKKPNGKGGGKGENSSESFVKAAAQQAKIRNELQKMRSSMKNGPLKKGLDGLSKLMEETETDLIHKRITQQTIKRQKEILTRLLESEKADREREWDDKRTSVEGVDKQENRPQLYLEYLKKQQAETDLLQTTPVNFNTFYKRKTAEYFQNINQ